MWVPGRVAALHSRHPMVALDLMRRGCAFRFSTRRRASNLRLALPLPTLQRCSLSGSPRIGSRLVPAMFLQTTPTPAPPPAQCSMAYRAGSTVPRVQTTSTRCGTGPLVLDGWRCSRGAGEAEHWNASCLPRPAGHAPHIGDTVEWERRRGRTRLCRFAAQSCA